MEEARTKLSEIVSKVIDPFDVKIIEDKLGNIAAFVQTKVSLPPSDLGYV